MRGDDQRSAITQQPVILRGCRIVAAFAVIAIRIIGIERLECVDDMKIVVGRLSAECELHVFTELRADIELALTEAAECRRIDHRCGEFTPRMQIDGAGQPAAERSEEHKSELQSLMRISY